MPKGYSTAPQGRRGGYNTKRRGGKITPLNYKIRCQKSHSHVTGFADLLHRGEDGSWRKRGRFESAEAAIGVLIICIGYGYILES